MEFSWQQQLHLALCTFVQVCIVVGSAWFFLRRRHFPIFGREFELTLIFNFMNFS